MPAQVLVHFRAGETREARSDALATVRPVRVKTLPGTQVALVSLQTGYGVLRAVRVLGSQDAVAIVEPNFILRSLDVVPNDPLFSLQWGMNNTGQSHPVADPPPDSVSGAAGADANVASAWDLTQGSSDTVIAIIDSGVDLAHPDLAPNIWVNPGEVASNGIDDDGDGFVDDVNGWDFVTNDNLPVPGDPHGTHVAGIVAAAANDGTGVAGVCPNCSILPIRAADDKGLTTTAAEIQSIRYAVDSGASIMNMSFGGPAWSLLERRAIRSAGKAGVLAVISAGNSAGNNDAFWASDQEVFSPMYPASYDLPTIVSVAASNDFDEYGYATGCAIQTNGDDRCFFTNYGHDSVDLAAPGVDILSTFPSAQYATADGTSMSAPFVAGAAGLIKSTHADYSALDLKNALLNSVAHPDNLAGGWTLTSGRLDAAIAINGSVSNATPVTDGSIPGAVSISTKKTGSLAYPGDVNDVYKKQLRAGHRYDAYLDVPKGQDFDLYVWAPGTLDVWEVVVVGCGNRCPLVAEGVKGKGKDEYVVFRAKTTGIFYFLVTDFDGKGKYALFVGAP